MKKIIILFMILFISIPVVQADDLFAPSSKSAILIEASTGEILYEKNANERLKPASMTKMMTLLLTFEAIERGDLNLTDEVIVTVIATGFEEESEPLYQSYARKTVQEEKFDPDEDSGDTDIPSFFRNRNF